MVFHISANRFIEEVEKYLKQLEKTRIIQRKVEKKLVQRIIEIRRSLGTSEADTDVERSGGSARS
ncbi:hypothetical protein BAQ53_06000 [Bacillus sp. B25(2016b)]|nr:hypothetical protein BAQ53_06000 [Bacillus sp. B25(2016b)]